MPKVEDIRNYPVKKSNDLVRKTSFALTSREYDMLQYIIMKIKDDDTELKPQEISIKDFCQVCGINETSGSNYKKIKQVLKGLADKSVWANVDGKLQTVRWIEDPIITPESGVITIKLKDIWKPYLLQLKSRYTVTTLYDMLPMSSVYGKRLYELLMSYQIGENPAKAIYEIEDLKTLLLGENDAKKKYQKFADFKRKVLEPALKDLSQYGSLDVEMTLKKEGRFYKYVTFKVSRKDFLEIAAASERSKLYFEVKEDGEEIEGQQGFSFLKN